MTRSQHPSSRRTRFFPGLPLGKTLLLLWALMPVLAGRRTLANTFSPAQATFPATAVRSTSAPVMVELTSLSSGTASTPSVLTEGVSDSAVAEFTISDYGTCGPNPSFSTAHQSCTVSVTFSPRFPGMRHGAVQLRSSGNQLLASTLISGLGRGSLPVLIPGQINTVVGNGQWYYQSDNVAATSASIYLPQGLAVDCSGNLYLSDSVNNRVRRVDAVTQNITTYAGNGNAGSSGDGDLATNAEIASPAGLALDGAGNLFIADSGNNTIRRVDAVTKIITTYAGIAGTGGFAGDGNLATQARLDFPQGLALTPSGDLLIADYNNARIRAVTSSDSTIQTIAGTGTANYSGDGGLATAAHLNQPSGVAVRSSDGAIAIADLGNNVIRLMTVGGDISTIAGNNTAGYSGDTHSALQAQLQGPTAVAFDPAGDLFIADSSNNCLRMIFASDGTITTLAGIPTDDRYAGDNGPDNQARMHGPDGLLFDATGNLWFSDRFNNRVRKVNGSTLVIGPYDTIKVSKTSPPVAESMLNAGDQPLVFGTPILQQAALDQASTTCAQAVLVASTLCNMGVEFAPTTVGNKITGSIQWPTNAPNVTPVDQPYGEVLTVEPTTTVLTSSANPGLLGQSITLTATVTSADTGRKGTVDFIEGNNTLCSAVPLDTNGLATCSISGLSLGTHNFVGNYSGDSNNASSPSDSFQEVIKQQAALSLGVSSSPVTVTSNVVLTLIAADSSGTPTGSATFYDGQTALATVTLDGSGHASWSTSSLAIGTHTLYAKYAGDTANVPGTSNTQTLQVTKANTTTGLASANNPATAGSEVALTATVTAQSGPVPTGTVQFLDGNTVLGTAPLNANGVATFALASLAPGSHNLQATYTGDAGKSASSSAVVAETIEQITTVTTLGADVDPANAGALVHFSAIVSMTPGAHADGDLTGTVTFQDGTTTLGSSPVNASGQATLAVSNLSVGSHHITASFSGDTNYAASTSVALSEVVQQTATAVTLVSASASIYAGKPASLTATVTSATGTPTGTVLFKDGSMALGSLALTSNGTATYTTSQLSTGAHTITAVYSGDSNYLAGSSATLQSVTLAPSALVLGGPSGSVDAGTNAAFTLVLATPGVAPTGTLTLLDGTSPAASLGVNAAGSFTLSTARLTVGTHILVASYSGDAHNAAVTSAVLTVVVQQAATTTTLSASSNPLTLGQPLTLTATIKSDSPHPGNLVTFSDGSLVLGTAAVNADGIATYSPANLALGLHPLTATYAGDTNHSGSTSTPVPELVVQNASVALSADVNPSVSGQSVTFSAHVAGTPTPTGTVQFLDNGASLGAAVLDANGNGSLVVATLAVGTHSITGAYSGDPHFSTGEAQLPHTVLHATTQAILTAGSNPAIFGQPLTLVAVVTSNGGPATGTVDFTDAGQVVGSSLLDASGRGVFTTSAFAPGEHAVVAIYRGDGRASASTSPALDLVVKQTTALSLVTSANPALTLSSVNLTATLSNAGAALATGPVLFLDGSTALGQATLDASGHATLTLPRLAAGTHSLLVTYAGDGKDFASQSQPVSEIVNLRTTTTTVTGTASDPSNPQQMTLIAVVHGEGSVAPSGLVTFTSGNLTLGAASVDETGVAAITVLFATPTQHIVASYAGDTSYTSSQSQSSAITAGQPAQFTVNVSSTQITLASHQRSTVTVLVGSVKGFTDNIALGCLGLPYAATCTFDHSQVKLQADGQVTASLVIDTGDPLGAGTSVSSLSSGGRALLCCTPLALLLSLFGRRGRRKHIPALLVLMFALLAASGLTGCSGLQMSGTPPGSYSLCVIGTGQGSNTTQAQTVTLVVTQ